MRILALLLIVSFALSMPTSAKAQRVNQQAQTPSAAATTGELGERIAAVVNESVISTADVNARVALALLTSGLPDTPEVRRHLLPQVLHGLIDEQLQLQEGKRQDISVSQEEIDKAMKRLAQDNNIPGGDMAAFLNGRGIPAETMIAQARAALTWNKVVARELRPRVDVGDDEVDAAIERMRANVGKEEYLVSEIYLAVDNPADEDRVRAFGENLVQQIKGGTRFGAIARQFSQGAGSTEGGDIGWIQAGQLGAELDKALQTMNGGDIAGPIRSANGFHILGVREKRAITLSGGDPKDDSVLLQQAFRPFASGNDGKADVLKDAEVLRGSVNTCDNLAANLGRDFPAWHWQDLGAVKLASAPKWLEGKVRGIADGHASEAVSTDKGALVLFVCGHKAGENVDRAAIINSIGTERMELLARRLLRDLRRDAYVDVRG